RRRKQWTPLSWLRLCWFAPWDSSSFVSATPAPSSSRRCAPEYSCCSAMAVGEDADNVYLREYLGQRSGRVQPGEYEAWLRAPGGASAYERRVACVRRYAFGVPNRAALEAIGRYAPIVELGA